MSAVRQTTARYPESRMPIAQRLLPASQAVSLETQRFLTLREEFLVDCGYNTARAYWADLQHLLEWAQHRGRDILALTEQDLRKYAALLRRRKYSESTIRRRHLAYRRFSALQTTASQSINEQVKSVY